MATGDYLDDELVPMEPLVGVSRPMSEAADTMLAASRNMLAAASALSFGLGPGGARAREQTAEAIETGFLRALRRDSLLSGTQGLGAATSVLGLPASGGIPGASYGRMGASVTGQGARAQLYGTVGGAIGYAVGGPVGAIIGGMIGGWLAGNGDDEAERARQEEQLRRQWLNTPEGFEIEAYLYNLARNRVPLRAPASLLVPSADRLAWPRLAYSPVVVNLLPGAVQITGGGTEAGESAARAFAGALGRVLRLNSVVVPAAGFGGDL